MGSGRGFGEGASGCDYKGSLLLKCSAALSLWIQRDVRPCLKVTLSLPPGAPPFKCWMTLATKHCMVHESCALPSDDDAVPEPRPRHGHCVVPGPPSHEVDVLLAVVAHDTAGLAHHLHPI